MFITTSLIAALAFAQSEAPVTLSRTFVKGQKLSYEYKATLHTESREYGLVTWIPDDVDFAYKFSMEVQELKNDGFAKVLYTRPTMTIIEGETANRGPKTTTHKTNWKLQMTLSPFNEITELKDLTPKKPEKPKPKEPDGDQEQLRVAAKAQGDLSNLLVDNLTSGLTDLMLLLGTLDSSLDFAPRLPFEELKVGETWKRTVGYSPQKLAGKEGKMASQRLDFTYTYKGLVKSGNTEVHRIVADLALDTNLADFMNQSIPEELKSRSLVKSLPFKMTSQIIFDLDKKTCHTVKAVATSDASSQIFLAIVQDAYDENKMHSKITLRMLPEPAPVPAKSAKSKPKPKKK